VRASILSVVSRRTVLIASLAVAALGAGLTAAAPARAENGCVVYQVQNATGEALVLADRDLDAEGALNAKARWAWVAVDGHPDCGGSQDPPQEIDPGTTWTFGAQCASAFGCSSFKDHVTYEQASPYAAHYGSAVRISFSDPLTGSNTAGWNSIPSHGSPAADFGVQSFSYNEHDQRGYDLKVNATICIVQGEGTQPGCRKSPSPRLRPAPARDAPAASHQPHPVKRVTS
jgi:hypothetical protein